MCQSPANLLLGTATRPRQPVCEPGPSFDQAPPNQPASDRAISNSNSNSFENFRETIDLLEADLTKMMGNVRRAAEVVRGGIRSAAEAIEAIRAHTGDLTGLSLSAQNGAIALGTTAEEFAKSSGEIGRQVQTANTLTDRVHDAASVAANNARGLGTSTAEISNVVNLISGFAKQTNLLALNASIEAARAGEHGRGFAVVAKEVKALSLETRQGADQIAHKVDALKSAAKDSIAAIDSITEATGTLRSVLSVVVAAVEQQMASVSELSRSAVDLANFVAAVADGANNIALLANEAANRNAVASESGDAVSQLAEKHRAGFVIFLRQSELGDRRHHDRLPCQLEIALHLPGGEVRGETIDLSAGGMLLRTFGNHTIPAATSVEATIAGIGRVRGRVVNHSALGYHLQFLTRDANFDAALNEKLATIRAENSEFIDRAVAGASAIAEAFEQFMTTGQITPEALFDNDYVPMEGSNPAQYRTRYLALLEEVLPPIQEPFLERDRRTRLACAVDRNGYLPVHHRIYSQPQKLGDVPWNTANSRNGRIFDDRAGLGAARNTRPYLIQSYARDMGDGTTVMLREIDVPIRVFGKHWGAFRTSYTL